MMYWVLLLACSAVLNSAWLREGYPFNAQHNLTSRWDGVAQVREDFRYDSLDRLADWTVEAQGQRSVHRFRHDDLGNLLGREVLQGEGNSLVFAYEPQAGVGPFAVTRSSLAAYGYDRHGNQVSAPNRRVAFNKCWGACTPAAEPPSSGAPGLSGDKPHPTSSADDNGPASTDPPGHGPTQGLPSPEQRSQAEVLDNLQTALDIGGMLPGIGLAFDVVNAGIHAARGNWEEAALSLAGAVPGVGDALKGAVLAKKAYMAAHAAKSIASTNALSIGGGLLGAAVTRGASKTKGVIPALPEWTKGQPTRGWLDTGKAQIELWSGKSGGPSALPLPGRNNTNFFHVEAHAAQTMRVEGLSEATLYINRAPCTVGPGCAKNLPHMLPEGARLRVIGPGGYNHTFVGLPDPPGYPK